MNIFAIGCLSGDVVLSLFEDAAILVTPRSQPRTGAFGLAAKDGVTRWKDAKVTIFRKTGVLPDDAPPSLFQDGRGRVWGFTGLAYLKDGRSVARAARRGGRVHFIAGGKALA